MNDLVEQTIDGNSYILFAGLNHKDVPSLVLGCKGCVFVYTKCPPKAACHPDLIYVKNTPEAIAAYISRRLE